MIRTFANTRNYPRITYRGFRHLDLKQRSIDEFDGEKWKRLLCNKAPLRYIQVITLNEAERFLI